MLSKLVKDIAHFMVVFLYMMFAFVAVTFIRRADESDLVFDFLSTSNDGLSGREQVVDCQEDMDYEEEHDGVDYGYEQKGFDQVVGVVLFFIVHIVMLNVLIAIVSDS